MTYRISTHPSPVFPEAQGTSQRLRSRLSRAPGIGRWLCLCLLLIGFSMRGQSATELRIQLAAELCFDTLPGKVYQLQGSVDYKSWVNLSAPVLGDGKHHVHSLSSKEVQSSGFKSYRVLVSDPAEQSHAPDAFKGLQISLRDDGFREYYHFVTDTAGKKVSQLDESPFSYRFTRVSGDSVRVEITRGSGFYYADRIELFTFTFTTAYSGTFVREEYRAGVLKDRDVGPFKVLDPSNKPEEPGPLAQLPPLSLEGLSGTFLDGEDTETLRFFSALKGIEFDDSDPSDFSYTYQVTGALTASLRVQFKAGRWDEYSLTFTAGGGGRGTYIRKEFESNQLEDTDSGPFRLFPTP